MYAVIRIRGTVNITRGVKDTLEMLRLDKVNACSLVLENSTYKGMLNAAKDWITWGEVEKNNLVEMLKKRLRLNGNKRVDETILKQIGIDSYEALADGLMAGKTKLKDFNQLQPLFRLTPPSKGFKSVKESFPKGDLGYRGKEINQLLMRMI
jgi:large subunit ribosomal protein L30